MQADPKDNCPSPHQFLMIGGLGQGALVLIAIGGAYLVSPNPLRLIEFQTSAIVLGLVLSLPLFCGFIYFWHSPARHLRNIRELFDRALVPMIRTAAYWHLAVVSALAGFGEELLFRGILQGELDQRFPTPVALVMASVLFGLAHSITRMYVLIAGLIGLLLGALMLLTDGLTTPIVVHAMYDFLALSYVKAKTRPLDPDDPGESP